MVSNNNGECVHCDSGDRLVKMEENIEHLEQLMKEHIAEFKEHRSEIRKVVLGNGRGIGLSAKVEVMWKVGIFVACTVVIETVALIYALLH